MGDFYNKDASDTFKTALQSLNALRREEGVRQVGRVASECVQEDIKQKYIKHYKLKESRVLDRCLCRLIGKRCPWRTGCGSSHDCIEFDPEVIDHPSLWNRNGKPFVYISQPYSLTVEGMQSIISVCAQHDLTARVSNNSWYYPTGTLFIEVHRKGWRNELYEEQESEG